MLPFLSLLFLAQAQVSQPPQPVFRPQEVRPLPGGLDAVPTFNSNSPEVVQTEGILLSTFPPTGKATPTAHLDFPFNGRFDVFAHHIARPGQDSRTLYLGLLLFNPGSTPVTVDVLQAASYLTQPDAPFHDLPPVIDNLKGTVWSGPGSRVTLDGLREVRQADWPGRMVLPAGSYALLMNRPISNPPNGRSTLASLRTSGPVYLASLTHYANRSAFGFEQPPRLEQWQALLTDGVQVTPRDLTPTPCDQTQGRFIYGRVSGVARGSRWQAELTDPDLDYLSLPPQGQRLSYVLSTANFGTLGTSQVQSAPMLVRYPDTAYLAHGNYGIAYNLTFTLKNTAPQSQTVTLTLDSPRKPAVDKAGGGLWFTQPPEKQVTFRGTVRIRYNDDRNLPQTRYVHLVLHRGETGQPLVTIRIPPSERRLILVDYRYPPDATPPQVLTLHTLEAPAS
ncbi:DUF3370 domain-containing protein [Anthocerotibacter panamensis]|uniref:DUF3370 domain-containing protein n=1 Tax=Anthocerotibacter panamensis TaxID=2857077 RepID=UPI001C405031|nr:DUF3370 domain-containing protein [Anthocerotibacter panamensis]